ncbi:MAG: 5-formyltetrahydrofolate cyclo-ligase, partial [Dokdonia sp.]
RFLSECKKEVIKVGLSFFEPEVEDIYTNDTDIALNYGVSDISTYKF